MRHDIIQKLSDLSDHFVDLNKLVSLYRKNHTYLQSNLIENNLCYAHFLKTPNSSLPLIPDPSPQHQGEGRQTLKHVQLEIFLLLMLGEGGELARRMRVERMESYTKTRTEKPYDYNFMNTRVKNGSFNQRKTLHEKASS